jgi:hypothetical protein
MASAYTNGESEDGEFLAVYLVRGSVLSLSFVEPHKRDRPRKSDEPDPRHAPGNVGCKADLHSWRGDF